MKTNDLQECIPRKITYMLIVGIILAFAVPFSIAAVFREQHETERKLQEKSDQNYTYANYYNAKQTYVRVKVLSVQPGLFYLEVEDGTKFHALTGELRYTK